MAQARRGNIGPPVDPAVTTKVVEFNDLPALEQALAPGDVACVLAEPVMTNVGIVHPEPGYHAGPARAHRKFGTLLIIDETHTICAGPGGYTRAENLEPDFLVFGKAIAGGVPGAAYGFTEAVAQLHRQRAEPRRLRHRRDRRNAGGQRAVTCGHAGHVDQSAHQRGVRAHDSPGRALDRGSAKNDHEFRLCPGTSPGWAAVLNICFLPRLRRMATEAHEAMDFELERFMHLYAMNRGILLTPFHNMALMSPQTDPADVDQHSRVFREAVKDLVL